MGCFLWTSFKLVVNLNSGTSFSNPDLCNEKLEHKRNHSTTK